MEHLKPALALLRGPGSGSAGWAGGRIETLAERRWNVRPPTGKKEHIVPVSGGATAKGE